MAEAAAMAAVRPWSAEAMRAFRADIDRIVALHRGAASADDIRHVRRYLALGRMVALAALALAAWRLNPISPALVALAQMTRWGIAHQILHRSYDAVPGCPTWLHGSRFAQGWRRYVDWCDWIVPAAWQMEHNVHHVHTGDAGDPDIVEANMEFLRLAKMPRWRKVAVAILVMGTWRLSYYAPSTLIQLRRHERGLPPTTYTITGVMMFAPMFNPLTGHGRDFWRRCILPYATVRFVVVPLMFAGFGASAVVNVLVTQVVADILLNFYSWALIASSHTAADLHRFDHAPAGKDDWYLHQVLGTANYSQGPGLADWAHGWVNYQVEHHLCPSLTLLQLERVSAAVRSACAAHGVPYVAEPLPRRFVKMFGVVTGTASMRRCAVPAERRGVSRPT